MIARCSFLGYKTSTRKPRKRLFKIFSKNYIVIHLRLNTKDHCVVEATTSDFLSAHISTRDMLKEGRVDRRRRSELFHLWVETRKQGWRVSFL